MTENEKRGETISEASANRFSQRAVFGPGGSREEFGDSAARH